MLISLILSALLRIIDLALSIYIVLIIARALLSWITLPSYHPVITLIYKVTEPVLKPFRKLIPPVGGIDVSPLVVIFLIYFLQELLAILRLKILF
ncbi:MAG: YggT family protein [Caldimicrobium sp.]